MADINVASPSDVGIVSQFPADERASRTALLALTTGMATWGGTSGGSANTQTVTVDNTGWVLTNEPMVFFIAGFTTTAADPTLQVNSTTAKTVKGPDGETLGIGAIFAGRMHFVRYDGTNWRLLNPAPRTLETSVGTGTTFDITGLPASASKIIISLADIGIDETANLQLRLGDSGGVESTGYEGTTTRFVTTPTISISTHGTGFLIDSALGTASRVNATLMLNLVNKAGFDWAIQGTVDRDDTISDFVVGWKGLTSALTTLRLTTGGGTANFNSGTVRAYIE